MAERKAPLVEEKARISVECAYGGCPHDATIRLQTPTGWANVCNGHYHMRISADAHAFTKAHGLQTVDQMRAFIKGKNIGARGKMHGDFLNAHLRNKPAEREPGQDDEELEAAHA